MEERYFRTCGSRDEAKMDETFIAEHNMVELCIAMWAKRILSVVWMVLAVCLFGVGGYYFFVVLAVVESVLSVVSSIKAEILIDELQKNFNSKENEQ